MSRNTIELKCPTCGEKKACDRVQDQGRVRDFNGDGDGDKNIGGINYYRRTRECPKCGLFATAEVDEFVVRRFAQLLQERSRLREELKRVLEMISPIS